MNKFLACCAIFLAGCTTVPVMPTFPEAPDILLENCPALLRLEQGSKLSDLLIVVTENYIRYHECAIKQKAWTEWYTQQKKIFEEAASK